MGRETNSVYGETLSGVQTKNVEHQFLGMVDPFMKEEIQKWIVGSNK